MKSGRLSDLISQLQEVINGVNAAETSPGKYDTALLAAQVLHYFFVVNYIHLVLIKVDSSVVLKEKKIKVKNITILFKTLCHMILQI